MIRIVTDSSCDLPESVVTDLRVRVVPLTIRFGDDDFVDREELGIDAFWERLTSGEVVPETAAPAVGRFLATYRELADEGADGIVVLTISSGISATHQSASIAAEQFTSGIPVAVVDSGLVSGALGLAVVSAAQIAATGATFDEVEADATAAVAEANLFAALDTLEYLRRGGRIGGAAAFFGNLLDVKPLITFSDGLVHPGGRVRTRRKAVAAVLHHLDGLGHVPSLAVIHSDPDDLEAFMAALGERGHPDPLVCRLGPVVGTHAGPGVVGIAYRQT